MCVCTCSCFTASASHSAPTGWSTLTTSWPHRVTSSAERACLFTALSMPLSSTRSMHALTVAPDGEEEGARRWEQSPVRGTGTVSARDSGSSLRGGFHFQAVTSTVAEAERYSCKSNSTGGGGGGRGERGTLCGRGDQLLGGESTAVTRNLFPLSTITLEDTSARFISNAHI